MVQVSFEWPRKTGTPTVQGVIGPKSSCHLRPIKCKTKTNRNLHLLFFPRFRQLTCFFSNFSLNPCDTFFCPDWLIDFYEFGSRLLTEIRLVLTILIFFMFLCNNVLSDLFKLEMGTLDFLELRYRVSSPRQNITLLLQIFFKLSTSFFFFVCFHFNSSHLIRSIGPSI